MTEEHVDPHIEDIEAAVLQEVRRDPNWIVHTAGHSTLKARHRTVTQALRD